MKLTKSHFSKSFCFDKSISWNSDLEWFWTMLVLFQKSDFNLKKTKIMKKKQEVTDFFSNLQSSHIALRSRPQAIWRDHDINAETFLYFGFQRKTQSYRKFSKFIKQPYRLRSRDLWRNGQLCKFDFGSIIGPCF